MDETTTAPTTSGRASSGGGRLEKMALKNTGRAKNRNRRRSRSRFGCRSLAGVNTDRSERA